MNTKFIFSFLIILTFSTSQAMEDHWFRHWSAKQASQANISTVKIFLKEAGYGIFVAVGVNITMSIYSLVATGISRAVFGPTNEDKINNLMLAKEIQGLNERRIALSKNLEDLKKGQFKTYVKTMKTRIAECNTAEEKTALENDLKTTLEKLSNHAKNNLVRATAP